MNEAWFECNGLKFKCASPAALVVHNVLKAKSAMSESDWLKHIHGKFSVSGTLTSVHFIPPHWPRFLGPGSYN